MIKPLLLLTYSLIMLSGFSQTKEAEFGLYFGNDFKNDSVTILIDGVCIAQNIKLKPTMIDPKNLVIVQRDGELAIRPYYAKMQTVTPIKIHNNILHLSIIMNNRKQNYVFDLTKGKYLYAGYRYLIIGWSYMKLVTIFQDTMGPIYI